MAGTKEISKKDIIATHFRAIMLELGLDMTDPNFEGTPDRVAKLYLDELTTGLRKENFPKIVSFPTETENLRHYTGLLIEKNITFYSICAHHFLPIVGTCTVGYIPGKEVVGLSKLIRVVQHLCRKPSIQEKLTIEILHHISEITGSPNAFVYMEAVHYCCKMRGASDPHASTVTFRVSGATLNEPENRREILQLIK